MDAVLSVAGDPNLQIRKTAIDSLRWLTNVPTVRGIEVLQRRADEEPDPVVRAKAFHSLARLIFYRDRDRDTGVPSDHLIPWLADA